MNMRAGFVCLLFLGIPFASHAEENGTCASAPVAVAAQPGMRLSIDSSPAEVDVTGTDEMEIRASCTVGDSYQAGDVHIRLDHIGDLGTLQIHGGTRNNVHIRVEVPRKTHLRLRIPAGEVRIDNLVGDKDIDAVAGEIVISGVNAEKYRWVHASVQIGEVSARPYGEDKGGFFRTVEKSSDEGQYRLSAHVLTGRIELD